MTGPYPVTRSQVVMIDDSLELTNPQVRSQVNVDLDDITGDSYTTTTSIGVQAAEDGYSGIVAPSAREPGGVNVVTFDEPR